MTMIDDPKLAPAAPGVFGIFLRDSVNDRDPYPILWGAHERNIHGRMRRRDPDFLQAAGKVLFSYGYSVIIRHRLRTDALMALCETYPPIAHHDDLAEIVDTMLSTRQAPRTKRRGLRG